MNRRNRMLIVLLIAVGLASAASYAVYNAITRMPVREVEVASVKVAVAVENLPTGTRLTKDHIKLVGWPASSPVEGGFAKVEDVVGRGLVQSVYTNEPLTEGKLAPIEAGAGLPPTITPGMRAMAVRVNDVISVAGFTVPGSRVDLLVTLKDGQDTVTRAVVSNLQVLTAGTRYDVEKGKDGQAMPSRVVTLLVTPEDAERITLAEQLGSIMLVLRNPLDTEPTDTRGARVASLRGAPPPAPVVKAVNGQRRAYTPKPAAPPEPQIYSIEAVRGGKRRVEVVGGDSGGEKN